MPVIDTTLLSDRAFFALISLLLSCLCGHFLARHSRFSALCNALHQGLHHYLQKLNKESRAAITRAMRGALLFCLFLIGFFILGRTLNTIFTLYDGPYILAVEVLLMVIMLRADLALRPLWQAQKHPDHLPTLLHRLSCLWLDANDRHGQYRLLITQSIFHLAHRIIGTLSVYLLYGWKGVALYRCCCIFYQHSLPFHPKWQAFSLVYAAISRRILQLFSPITHILAIISTLVLPNGRFFKGLRHVFADSTLCFAAILSISLGGPYSQYGIQTPHPFLGKGSAQLTKTHAKHAARLIAGCLALYGLLLASLSLQS